jgi:hypothetical protein
MLEFQGALCDPHSGGQRCEAFGKLPVLLDDWHIEKEGPKVLALEDGLQVSLSASPNSYFDGRTQTSLVA